MDRNAVETIGRERCVKPPDVVNLEDSASKYRRVQLSSESCTYTTRSQIWDGGGDSQVAA